MPRRTSPLIALVLSTVVLVGFAPILLGGKTWSDARYHVEIAPPRMAAAQTVQAGELPTWWNGTALGVPLLGEPSHGAAYPPVWIASTPRLLDLLWIVHVLWCALGIALWARRLRASEVGALVAGVLVATSGLATSAALRGALPALAHLPWVGFAASRLATTKLRDIRARYTVFVAALIGAIGLAGQLAVLVHAIAIAIIGGLDHAKARQPRSGDERAPEPKSPAWRLGGSTRFLLIGIAAGLAIASVQWLPAMFAIGDGTGTTVNAMSLSRIVEVIVPGCFGSSDPTRGIAEIAGAAPSFPSLYIGAPVFALAALASPRRRYAVFAFVLVVLAFVVGRGGWPAWLGAPELHVAALALIAAAHAGSGVDTVLAGERRALIGLAIAATTIALALGGLGALSSRVASDAIDRAFITGGLALICTVGALLLAWRTTWLQTTRPITASEGAAGEGDDEEPARDGPDLSRRARSGVESRALVIAVLIVAPSVGSVAVTAPTAERALVDRPPAWVDAAVAKTDYTIVDEQDPIAGAGGAPIRVFRPIMAFAGDKHAEPESLDDAIATLAGTSAATWGIAAARSDDPARPRIHDRVWLAAAGAGGTLLERYGIELAILPISMVGGRGLRQVASRGNWALVRYPASPPAALVYEWMFAADVDTAIARLFPPGVDRGLGSGLIVLAGHGAENQDEPSAAQPCAIDGWSATAIDLTCNADRPAYAVVSSTAAAGWSVELDGTAVPWRVADVMRRAVAVPAGAHRIAWRYTAPGLTIAFVLAAAGIVALVALWLVYGRDSDARDDTADPARTDVS